MVVLTRIILAAALLLPPVAWAGMFRRDPPRLMLVRPGCTVETVIEAGDPTRELYRIPPEKLPTCVVISESYAATVTGRCADSTERVAAVVREFDTTLCGGGDASR